MAATIKPSLARRINPAFFTSRPADVNWTLRVSAANGDQYEFVGADWEARSRFGKVTSEVAVDDSGKPVFDRPAYHETPCVNVVAWGRDQRTGEIKIGLISESRPHPNHPELPDSTEPLCFTQIPMGFVEKILGKDGLRQLELGSTAAAREVMEETGAKVVCGSSKPRCPYQIYSPTFMATWAGVHFIEIDLEAVEAVRATRDEPIYKAEFVTVKELLARIREGQDADGNIFRGSSSLSALMMFFAQYPEFWPK